MDHPQQVTIYRESFLNGDCELRDEHGNKVDCDWDVSWATDRDGKALHWGGMTHGSKVYADDELLFTAGQTGASDA